MQPTNLRNQLIILGAQARLLTLNKERDELLKILNQTDSITLKENSIIKDLEKHKAKKRYTRKNPHWMQKPENRAKVLRMIRKANRAKKNGAK